MTFRINVTTNSDRPRPKAESAESILVALAAAMLRPAEDPTQAEASGVSVALPPTGLWASIGSAGLPAGSTAGSFLPMKQSPPGLPEGRNRVGQDAVVLRA